MRLVAIAFACTVGGCVDHRPADPPSTAAEQQLIGELSLHELFPPAWTHAWAAFLDPKQPLPPANVESVWTPLPEPTPAVDHCDIITAATCALQCPETAVCVWARCVNRRPGAFIDVGRVHVTGGSGPLAPMNLAFGAVDGIYLSMPVPGPGFLFTGGEILDITFHTGGSLPALAAQFEAPPFLEMTSPDVQMLHVPTSGPLHIAWNPAHKSALELVLAVSSNTSGDSKILRCTLEDDGAFDVGPELLAQLPPPPRSVHLELSRLTRQLAPVGPNRAILIHGGFTVGGNGTDQAEH